MAPQLFTPFDLRGLTLANRIVVSPMGQYSGNGKGLATDWHLMHLGNLAISGAGLLIIEATAVERAGCVSGYDLGLWSDEHIAALERPIAFCRRHGSAKLGMQLAHAGRKGGVSVAWEGQTPIEDDDWTVFAPSELAYPGRAVPAALDEAGLKRVRAAFQNAAQRADALGLDLLELHAAHGYLLSSFLSPLANKRNDAYGGDTIGRMRFPLEVFAAIRNVWPEHKPLGVRISATDWVDGGWTVAESIAFAEALKAAGCDYVTASSGGNSPDQRIPVGPGYQLPLARAIREAVDISVMGVGLITKPEEAEAAIAAGDADLIALARGMLYEPRWPWHAAHALGFEATFPPQYERAHPAMRGGDFLKPKRD